ncbi:ATP-binding cassette domain-containing protein [Aurantimonas sp. VKM B-3413]|uniref:ATP-binding cassette domain-containing protein n=1 Tax=Aurantimonas sp. VKM B-3413 TaxID=2779401 RepID=UPI001E637D88|nr:ATP-binding cassette domain-containing protein [Aurantimonas sp. VKM B-3413]
MLADTFGYEQVEAGRRDGTPPRADEETSGAAFCVDGLGFAVRGRSLLGPLDLSLKKGGVIGLVGHNGSGKSTLVKLLARQEAPTAGAIHFDGRPLGAWGDRAFARAVAYLPQHTPLAPGMLVSELVALGRYPWHGALGRFTNADREKVAEAMALTDTAHYADRFVDTLSGGERQRVWLAMLIAQNAGCLLLDEPTSALDIAHQIEVLSLVRKLSRERGVTVIVVLHEINMAARFCDEIVALRAGRLVARGEPRDIMTPETLESITGIAMGVLVHPEGGAPIAYPHG